eukprot:TRINITY_DN19915_c0_g1_i1.p1 TRINITY_DN19915_c0_g1~~TRINITY_DN19915_c0_g1_i1.p1  ORF type:complete len:201 (+),score=34.71 TRINITY_DN19915_c0_g1_i1:85-687(+)
MIAEVYSDGNPILCKEDFGAIRNRKLEDEVVGMIEKLRDVNNHIKKMMAYMTKNVSLDSVMEDLSSIAETSNIPNDLEAMIHSSRGMEEEFTPISKVGNNKNEKQLLNVFSTTLLPQNIDNENGKRPVTFISHKIKIQKFKFDVEKLKNGVVEEVARKIAEISAGDTHTEIEMTNWYLHPSPSSFSLTSCPAGSIMNREN